MTTENLLRRIAVTGAMIRESLQPFETDLREAVQPIHWNAIPPDGQRDILKLLEHTQKLAHYLLPPVPPPHEYDALEVRP